MREGSNHELAHSNTTTGQGSTHLKTWRGSWAHFTTFLQFPPEIWRVVYTTNMIESRGARFLQAVRRRGHFPTDQAALKVLPGHPRPRPPQEPAERRRPHPRL
ncbi:transposase [Nocardia sputorum]|uniref:transposase n=1 Tax=Nocardia sputorum TaxID=2984338 RepID=UPI0024905B17|nr:transposase [Nocardia sputorum]